MFFYGPVSDADLLLALDGNNEFGWLLGGVGAGFHWHSRHLLHLGAMCVGCMLIRWTCGSGTFFLHRDEVHAANGTLGFRVLRFDRGMHGTGVVIDVAGLLGRGFLFNRDEVHGTDGAFVGWALLLH